MKKKFLNVLRAASLLLVACAVVVACSDDKTSDPGGNGGGPDKPDPGIPDTEEGAKVTESIPTPLTYYVRSYDPGADGVKIHVNTTVDDNIIFTCTPGEKVKSYRLNVYPLIAIYDMLLDQLPEDRDKFSVSECEELLFQMVNKGSTPSSLFTSGKALNDESKNIVYLEDFAETEFDWSNTSYNKFALLAGAEYLIVAEAYLGADGSQDASRSLVYAKTTSQELVGDPQVEIKLEESYTSYEAVHLPNAEAGGVNFFGAPTAGIQKFLDAFGMSRYINYVRYMQGGSIDAAESAKMTFKRTDLATGLAMTHTAFAVDANGTPNPDSFVRRDFRTKEIPTDIPAPDFNITWDETKTNSSLAYFNVTMDKNCYFTRVMMMRKAAAEKLLNGGQAAEVSLIAQIAQGLGYYIKNPKFKSEAGYPIGEGSTLRYSFVDYMRDDLLESLNLEPDTEYMCLCIGLDGYNRAVNKLITLPFKTKKRVMDTPEASKAEIAFEIAATGPERTGFTINITYNPETTASYHYQTIVPGPPDPKAISGYFTNLPNFVTEFCSMETTNRQQWEWWFYDAIQMTQGGPSQWSNCWYCSNKAGVDQLGYFGCNPGTHYVVAYMAEDYDGVCGPVKFFEGSTLDNEGGPNPVIEITGALDDTKTKVGFIYKANTDMTIFDYQLGKGSDYLLHRLTDENYTYEDIITHWKTKLLATALHFKGFTMAQETTTAEPTVALALPYGKDAVEGEMKHLLYIDGEFKLLEDFKTPAAPSQAKKQARVVKNIPASGWKTQHIPDPNRPVNSVPAPQSMRPGLN